MKLAKSTKQPASSALLIQNLPSVQNEIAAFIDAR